MIKQQLQLKYLLTVLGILVMQVALLAQTNIAPTAVASGAPACNTGPCSTLNDLNFGTCGTQQTWLTSAATNPGSAVNLTFEWTSPQVIKGITVHAGQTGSRYLGGGTIEVWNGTTWVAHHPFTQTNTSLCSYDVDFNPVATSRLRIVDMVVIGTQQSNVNFREIEIWQGSLANNDIGVSSIDSINTICTTGPIPIHASVRNYGKNLITSLTVNWSINGALQTPFLWTGTLDTIGGAGPSSTNVLLGTHGFGALPTTIKAWSSQPNNLVDTSRTNDTSTIVKSVGLAAGIYTIGGISPNYASFTAAFDALKSRGICGPVVFQVRSGVYNEQIDFNSVINGASAINTITFEGVNKNTCILNRAASTSTTDRHTLRVSATRFLVFRNLTIQGNGDINGHTSYPVIINGTASDIAIKNCVIRIAGDDAQNSTSTNYIAIVLGGTSSSYSTAAIMNRIQIDSNIINNGYFGLVHYSSSNASTDNTFRYNVLNNQYYYGYFVTQYNNLTIENNTFNLRLATTGVTPIYVSGASATVDRFSSIVGNRINGFGSYAMYLATVSNGIGTKGIIANNVVYGNISATGYGIYLSSPNRFMIYHNSVNMDLGGTTSNAYAGLYITGGTQNSIINNKFARTAPGMGLAMYITATSVADTINYNSYFKADTTTGLIYIGTLRNPSTFRNLTGFDSASYYASPDFISSTNLNITNGCQNGIYLPNVDKDINGVTRNTSTPDVGAFEIVSVNNDMQVVSITQPTVPISVGFTDVWVHVRNTGANSVSSYDVGYINNTGTPQIQSIFSPLNACDTATIVFTGSQQVLLSNVNFLKAFTSNPNAVSDGYAQNDTLFASYFTPLIGNFTIGGSTADFPTIQAAVATLKQAGIAGPVNFTINPGTYTGKVTIDGPINGLNASTPIVFDGVNRNLVSLEANLASQAVFLIDKVNYINVRNITVTNYSPTGAGISIVGTTSSNAGTGCSIVGCEIKMPNYTTGTAYPIAVTGSANGYGVSAMRADSITIDSNITTGGYYAITAYGASSNLYNRYLRIRGNVCNNVYYMGAYIGYNYNAIEFTHNHFEMNTAYGYYGIYFYSNQNSSTTVGHLIANNRVINHGGYGLYAYFPTTNSSTSAITTVINNMVTGGPTYGLVYGIAVQDQSSSRSRILHNTSLTRFASTTATYAALYTTGSANVVVKNNICVNLAGAGCAANFNTSPAAGNVNYNLYFNTANNDLIRRAGVAYTSSNYKTPTAGGDSSFNQNPMFVSATDLHTTNSCLPRGVDLTSIVPLDFDGLVRSTSPMVGADEIGAFINDIEIASVIKPTVPVDTGLQEVKIVVRNAGSTTVSSYNVTYINNGGTPVTQAYTGLGLAPCEVDTMTFSGLNQINILNGVNNFAAYTSAPNATVDGNPTNDTIRIVIGTPLIGTYIVGNAPSDFPSITVALNAAKNRGIKGHVTLALKTGVYNDSYVLDPIPGASDSTTITITSQANHRDSVLLQYFTNTGTPTAVIDIVGSYYKLKNLSIRQQNGNIASRVINYIGNASFDTVDNCVIWGPIYGIDGTSTSTYTIYGTGLNSRGLAFVNNYIKGSFYGAYIYGNTSTYGVKDLFVNNNLFDSTAYGAWYYMYYTTRTKFTNNVMIHRVVTPTYTTGYEYFYYNDTNFTYTNNVTNFVGAKGLYRYGYYTRNTVSARAIVANNTSNATSSLFNWYFGNSVTSNIDIVHNTLSFGSGYFYLANSGLTGVRVLNNIFRSNQVYAYYISTLPTSYTALISDHNLVFAQATSPTPYFAGSARTLAQMQAVVPSYERNSVVYRPPFTSNTDISPNANDSAIWLINGRGTQVASSLFPVDVNSATRPTNVINGAPDLGAHEVTPAAGVLPPLATASPSTPVAGTTQHFLLGQDSVASITWDALTTAPATAGIRYYTGAAPILQGSSGKAANAFWALSTTGSGFYLYDININYKSTLLGSITPQLNVRSAHYPNTSWTSNIGTNSTVDSVRGAVFTPAMNMENGIYALTDDTDPIISFLTITAQPQSQAKCNGDSVMFITGAIGTGITYQWQENSGSGWSNISGATNDTLVVNNLNATYNGRQYRCSIGSLSGSANTNVANLQIGTATVLTSQPANFSTCEGDNAIFTVSATGTNLTYQWEENTGSGFAPISGAVSPTLYRSFVNGGMSGYSYRCVITGTCGVVTSNAATLTVNTIINVSVQPTPTSTTVCAGSNVQIVMNATGVLNYQWQINTGSGFANIPGATNDTLVITNIPASYNNGIIRCALVGGCNITFTNTATISVETPGTWTGNTSTAWATASNWGCGQLPTSSSNITIPATAVNMPVISSAVTMNHLTIENGAVLSLTTSSAVLNVTGNFTNNGTLINTNGTLAFTGTSAQTIQAGTYTGKMNVNNTAGVVLGGNVTITDTLTLINGIVTLGNFNLTIGNTGAILGGNILRYVRTNGSGGLTINNIGAGGRAGAVVFPVGNNATHSNMLTITNAGTADNFTVRSFAGVYRDYTGSTPVLSSALTNNAVATSWIIDEEVAGGSDATVTVEWVLSQELAGFTRSNCYVSRYNGVWNPGAAGAAVGSNPYTRTITGLTSFSPFSVGSNSALPVEMLSFTAKPSGKAALLNWSTASEINNSHFVIERSVDNVNFVAIGKVAGNNNSLQTISYNFVDNDAKAQSVNNTVYYRLTQVDVDGVLNQAGNAYVTFESGEVKTTVAPNPFTNVFTVSLKEVSNHVIVVRDLTGKIVVTKHVNNSSTVEIHEMAELSSGVYFLNVDNETTIKIIKQ